jgi:hypothetical protein
MLFSYIGMCVALLYVAAAGYSVAKLAITKSFGGIWSQEFGAFVMTLPWSAVADSIFKKTNLAYDAQYIRIGVYCISVLLNAVIIYCAFAVLGVLVTKMLQWVR